MRDSDAKSLVGCCGLYCGLCNKYQSKAPSRCVGCRLGEQHAWCSIWNCCVKKRGLETCAECPEVFKCPIFVRREVAAWIPAADNLRQIRTAGLRAWLREQKERQALLEDLLGHYNEGRSMTLYCKACARMPIDLIKKARKATKEKVTSEKVDNADLRSKARVLKAAIKATALKAGINLD